MESDPNTFDFYTTDPVQHAYSFITDSLKYPHADTRQIAKKALEISNKCLEAWLLLAQSYQKFPQARTTYLKGIEVAREQDTTSTLLQLLYGLGELYYRHGHPESAIETILELLPLDESDPCNAREILTLSYLQQEDFIKAHACATHSSYDDSLSSRVAQAYIAFRTEIPWWTPDQMDQLDDELLGRTTWQWMHEQCNSLKRLYRQINHANPFFAAFMLNPHAQSIETPTTIESKHASEALHVTKLHHDLWHNQELPIKLLEEFPWTNPTKSQIKAADKPILLETIQQLEKHRDAQRSAAEKDYLQNRDLY
ncbi:tetratricopeptide repeat protein [Rubritalea spongiae]|uniref:Tetratricopeptide repeat protein n=2 Tax=Rubritalea spongiae TaxID=430797 RepID=A0ABW5E508_9BACT